MFCSRVQSSALLSDIEDGHFRHLDSRTHRIQQQTRQGEFLFHRLGIYGESGGRYRSAHDQAASPAAEGYRHSALLNSLRLDLLPFSFQIKLQYPFS